MAPGPSVAATVRGRLRALSRASNRRGLLQLAGHGAALSLSTTLIVSTQGSPWLLPLVPLQAVLLIFLFAPLHETIHFTAFRSRSLNKAVAAVCGWLLLLPSCYFRAFHLAHHRHTQDPRSDPELAQPKPASRAAWLWHVSGLPTWGTAIALILRHALGEVGEGFVARRERPRLVRQARLYLALYAATALLSIAAESALVLWLWVGPALLGQPVLRLFLLPEHGGCPLVPDMLRNSRTTRSTALLRALAWNMPYHAEHHYFPALPFHALPAAHELLAPGIEQQAPGYLAANLAIVRRLP